jgi:sugar phosphate isomerase/epimerase
MIPCISQVTTLPSDFATDVCAYSEVGCTAIEVWLTKLETYLDGHSMDDVARLIAERGVALQAASVHGGILLSQGGARRESFALLERRLDLCRRFDIPTLVVVADFAEQPAAADYDRAVVSLKQAGQSAARRGVSIALEFQSRASFCNNLCTAASLAEHCDEPNVGVCLDVYHYYTGPSKLEDLALVAPAKLLHVQLSDLAGVPRELAADSDRILPGDGDFQLGPILDHLRSIGYARAVSVELMNPTLWQLPTNQVAEVAITALRRLTILSQS